MDRREYARLYLNVESVFILQKNNLSRREFEGVLADISEGGFRIVADYGLYSDILDNANIDDIIYFSIPDEYELLGKEVAEIVTGQARILRKRIEDNQMVLGCEFVGHDQDLERYVRNRKTSAFMNGISESKDMIG